MSRPVRLHRQEPDSFDINKIVGGWMLRHPTATMIILFIALSVCFAILFNVIYEMCQMESAIPRNFFINQI